MIDNLSIAVHAFAKCKLMSFAVAYTLLLWNVNLVSNVRKPPFTAEMSPIGFEPKYTVVTNKLK